MNDVENVDDVHIHNSIPTVSHVVLWYISYQISKISCAIYFSKICLV